MGLLTGLSTIVTVLTVVVALAAALALGATALVVRDLVREHAATPGPAAPAPAGPRRASGLYAVHSQ